VVTTATTQAPTPDQERPDRERTEHLPLRFLDADLLQEPTWGQLSDDGTMFATSDERTGDRERERRRVQPL